MFLNCQQYVRLPLFTNWKMVLNNYCLLRALSIGCIKKHAHKLKRNKMITVPWWRNNVSLFASMSFRLENYLTRWYHILQNLNKQDYLSHYSIYTLRFFLEAATPKQKLPSPDAVSETLSISSKFGEKTWTSFKENCNLNQNWAYFEHYLSIAIEK